MRQTSIKPIWKYVVLSATDILFILILTTISVVQLLNGSTDTPFAETALPGYVLFFAPFYALAHGIAAYCLLKKILFPNLIFGATNFICYSIGYTTFFSIIPDSVWTFLNCLSLSIITTVILTIITFIGSLITFGIYRLGQKTKED